MPMYDYKCQKCENKETFTLSMGHDIPTNKDIKHTSKKCKEDSTPLQRIYTPINSTWGGISGNCERPTDSSSATKEKNEKLKKLYNESLVPDLK